MGNVSQTFLWLPALTLAHREVVRFYRQRSRWMGALGTPLVFWLLLGLGVGSHFQSPLVREGMSYLEYFFPGSLVLILLFTCIFSSISIIEDRREGFLQSVMVAPVARLGIVLGKVLGGTVLSTCQGLLFLIFSPLAGAPFDVSGLFLTFISISVISFSLSALGFLLAWKFNSVQGFHAVMNLILFPMWLLSGALFPVTGAPGWLRLIMNANPLTHGVNAVRLSLSADFGTSTFFSLSITMGFGMLFALLGAGLVSQRSYKNAV